MKTSSAKAKGRRAAKRLRDTLLLFADWLEDEDIQVTPSGVTGPDLYLSPRAKQSLPIDFEVKNVERLNIWEALEQVIKREKEGIYPAVVFSRNRSDSYMVMRINDLLEFAHEFKKRN